MNLCECLREDTGSASLSPIDPKNPGPPIARRLWEGPSCPLGLSFLLCFGVPRDSGLSLPFDRRRLVNLSPPPTSCLCCGTIFLRYLNNRGHLNHDTADLQPHGRCSFLGPLSTRNGMTSGSSGLRQGLLDPRGIIGARWDSWVLRDQRAGHLDTRVPGEQGKRIMELWSEGRTGGDWESWFSGRALEDLMHPSRCLWTQECKDYHRLQSQ